MLGRLTPALQRLLDAAAAAGAIRTDVDAAELLLAGMRVAAPASDGDIAQARRMVALMVDGLRFGAGAPTGRRADIAAVRRSRRRPGVPRIKQPRR